MSYGLPSDGIIGVDVCLWTVLPATGLIIETSCLPHARTHAPSMHVKYQVNVPCIFRS